MRTRVLVAMVVAGIGLGVTTAHGAGDRRLAVGGGVSIALPPGWHVVHSRATYVIVPIPRLALATFPVTFARHSCACGTPNLAGFPRRGAFVFVWEWPVPARRALRGYPRRPAHFHVAASAIKPYECAGPSDAIMFQQRRRAFVVNIYLGPAAPPAVRAQIAAMLDSWRVTPGPIPSPLGRRPRLSAGAPPSPAPGSATPRRRG